MAQNNGTYNEMLMALYTWNGNQQNTQQHHQNNTITNKNGGVVEGDASGNVNFGANSHVHFGNSTGDMNHSSNGTMNKTVNYNNRNDHGDDMTDDSPSEDEDDHDHEGNKHDARGDVTQEDVVNQGGNVGDDNEEEDNDDGDIDIAIGLNGGAKDIKLRSDEEEKVPGDGMNENQKIASVRDPNKSDDSNNKEVDPFKFGMKLINQMTGEELDEFLKVSPGIFNVNDKNRDVKKQSKSGDQVRSIDILNVKESPFKVGDMLYQFSCLTIFVFCCYCVVGFEWFISYLFLFLFYCKYF